MTTQAEFVHACGHTASGGGFSYECDRPLGHKGWHGQTDQLRGGVRETTNWGDDGLAIWASKDEARRRESGGRS